MPRFAALALALVLLCAASAAASAATSTDAPTVKSPPPGSFVALHDIAPGIVQEMRYTGRHNFVGKRIRGYREATCLLTVPAARAVARVHRQLRRRGLGLKVYDCYRPQRAVNHFVEWAENLKDRRMKREFYPRVKKTRLFLDGYIAARSGHSRGSTLDLTIIRRPATPQPRYRPGARLVPCYFPGRFRDNSLAMGTGFDCFDRRSHTLNPVVRGKARKNRLFLKGLMEKAGFKNLPEEWWHYTLRQEPFADTYFDFPVAHASLR